MNRKSFGKLSIAATASAAAIVFVLHTGSVESQLMEQCEMVKAQSNHSVTTCQVSAQETVSWFDWIGGKSQSYQFHFLDLLELLYSDDSDNDDSFHSSPTSSI
ncbi:hypothetical protein QTP81_11680 [Alteromonas sp. ASW11-36]|uniref:Uncharacterized protein n=1 Tax=Alteromonas arenosi TaxID=3055817 RepID=A0ABT7SYL0_9ALTE|nr:hypothetical protein [Alteromonas sp. ASW11-36]MDM7861255.1 hypothetical protein [Alteromonas sp. ASW11-36]